MKVCTVCGDTYLDHIDFCFNDGEVLVGQASALDVPEPGHVAAQPQGPQIQPVPPTQPARSATPTPRAKRSLINRPSAVPAPAAYGAPPSDPGAPDAIPSHPTLIPTGGLSSPDDVDEDEEAPQGQSAFSQADTMPIPRRKQQPKTAPAPRPAPPPPVVQQDLFEDDLDDGPNKVLLAAVFAVAMALLVGGGAMILIGFGLLNTGSLTMADGAHKVVPATPEGSDIATAPDPAPSTEVDPEDTEPTPVDAEDEPADVEDEGALPDAPDEPDIPEEAVQPPPAPEPAPKQVAAVAAPKPAPQAAVAPKPAPPAVAPKPAPVEPAKSAVRVRSTPSGATAKINGHEVGMTPVNVELPVGSHEVVLELSGHKPMVRRIEIQSGEDNELPAWTLEPRDPAADDAKVPVMVFFAGRIGDELYVDGQFAGNLPARLDLAPGPHVFELKSEKNGDFSATREVVADAAGRVKFIHLSQ